MKRITSNIKILLVEDSVSDTELISSELSKQFTNFEVTRVDNEEDLVKALEDPINIILSDYSLPGFSGKLALDICLKLKPHVPFIYVSGTIGEERAVQTLKDGANDYVLKSNLGRLPFTVKNALDSAQEKVEKQRQRNEIKRLSMVASQVDNGVLIGDANFRTEWVNKAFVEKTGYSTEELSGIPFMEIIHFTKSDIPSIEEISRKLASGEYVQQELKILNKDGSIFWASLDVTPILDEEDRLKQVIAIINDISKRREVEIQRDQLLSTLEEKVQQRTIELQKANALLQKRNKKITDSIHYARYIQEAFIQDIDPEKIHIEEIFTSNFPKDVLSGDFHWHCHLEEEQLSYIALGDCTGHGIPGSLMTILAVQLLDQQVVKSKQKQSPSEILYKIDDAIVDFLGQNQENSRINDGMEVVLICIDYVNHTLTFSSAGRPLLFFSEEKLTAYPAPWYSVGGNYNNFKKTFTDHHIRYKKGDRFYAFSDGFSDQFGGPKGKKYSGRRKAEFLKSIQKEPFEIHEELLIREYLRWKKSYFQTDDVIMLGVEL